MPDNGSFERAFASVTALCASFLVIIDQKSRDIHPIDRSTPSGDVSGRHGPMVARSIPDRAVPGKSTLLSITPNCE